MALNENNKIINYTDLTYQDITAQVDAIFKADPRFKNYNEGELSVLITELFAGVADMLNYNIERASEEVFIDTAKRYRSAVKLSRNLNYDITRPIPSKASVKFIVNRATVGTKKTISIPQFTNLTFNGVNFVTSQSITLTVNESDTYVESNQIDIYQGEFKTIRFPGANNAQIGKQYQRYYIDDPTFCNFYGESDYKYGDFTLVGIGENSAEALNTDTGNLFDIRRVSLLAEDKIDEFKFNSSQTAPRYKICLLRTSAESEDGRGVELRFGDGTFIDNGLKNTGTSIYVRYFSCLGSKTNQLGVIGSAPAINNTNSISYDGLNKNELTTELTTNIITGSDLESVDSISANAPGVFQSFNRLVTKLDYISYLKSLTSPFDVKNAIAWGEQEELENIEFHQPETVNNTNAKPAIKKLFNVVLFSAIGPLYTQDVDTGSYQPNDDYRSIVVDDDLSIFRYPSQNYINVLGADEVVGQLYFQQQQFNAKFSTVDLVGNYNNQTVYYKGYPNFFSNTMPVLTDNEWERYTTNTEQEFLNLTETVTVPSGKYRDIPMQFTVTIKDKSKEYDDISVQSSRTLNKILPESGVGDPTWDGSFVCRKPYLESGDTSATQGLVLHQSDANGVPDDVLSGLLGEIVNPDSDFAAPYYTAWGDVAKNIETILNNSISSNVNAQSAGISFAVSVNIEQDTDFISALREKIRSYYTNYGSVTLQEIQNDRLGITYTKYIKFGITMTSNNASYDELQLTIKTLYSDAEKAYCLDNTNYYTAIGRGNICQNGQALDTNAYYFDMLTGYSYDSLVKEQIESDLFGFSGQSSFLKYRNNDYSNELSFIENMSNVITSLEDKAQITCRHIYISPIIQTFRIAGNLNIRSGVNGDEVLYRLKDRFYGWANEGVDYNIDVYISNIQKIFNEFNEITSSHIYLEPYNPMSKPFGRKYYFDYDSFKKGSHYVYTNLTGYDAVTGEIAPNSPVAQFQEIVYYNIDAYLKKYRLNDPDFDTDVKYVSDPASVGYQPGWPKCQNNVCYDVNSTSNCDSIAWTCEAIDPEYGSLPTPPNELYDPRYDSSTAEYDPSLYGVRYSSVAESHEIYSNSLWSDLNPKEKDQAYYTEDKVWYWSNEITERTFLYECVNGIVKDCTGKGRVGIGSIFTSDGFGNQRYNITKMPEFYSFINEIHLDFDEIIKSNIINTNGDIAPIYETIANTYGIRYKRKSSGGFSLKNEIPQFFVDVSYSYV